MKKIPTLFMRSEQDRARVTDSVTPGCEWVAAGEGLATRKIDGTCCMIRDGRLYRRREVFITRIIMGTPPDGFEEVDRDETTGKAFGWVPVGDGPDDRFHREAFAALLFIANGTYELVGPKVQGNPEDYLLHHLISHDALMLGSDVPRDFAGLSDWLAGRDIEGIVFHHEDGRRAKIKLRDFGLRRPAKAVAHG